MSSQADNQHHVRTQAFPWTDLMAFFMGTLRMAPKDFWAMTPKEVGVILHSYGISKSLPMQMHELGTLMQRYPDKAR